jgi:hypothetical protein
MLRRLIVLPSRQTKRPLAQGVDGLDRRSIELVEAPTMHDVGFDEPREGQRTANGGLQLLRHAQQQEGDQGDGDLDADGVVGGAEEAGDLQCLLDPAEEQLDIP